jgi:hypothetical protein
MLETGHYGSWELKTQSGLWKKKTFFLAT